MQTSDEVTDRWITVPNALCAIRFAGAWGLIVLAVLDRPSFVVGWFLFLTATDCVDGKLAIVLHQRSKIGPKLDTLADVTMYGCLVVAVVVLNGRAVLSEAVWIAPMLLSYAGSVFYSWWKFGVLPSYHTRAAKTCWFLILLSVTVLLVSGTVWPLRVTLLCVILTNIEAILITRKLTRPRSDIRWLGDAQLK